MSDGQVMYKLCEKMFPYCRSITGDDVRKTLQDLKDICPYLNIHEVPTGTKAFDWTVPKEWCVKDAWIKDSTGRTVLDYKLNNLHLVGYSIPVDKKVSLQELKNIVYTIPEQPNAIPYVTSYYEKRYGFCMTENLLQSLKDDIYHIYIESEFKSGSLSYGEILLQGKTDKEVFFSTYVCHPSMANDNLSGLSVLIYLAKWIASLNNRRYSYRLVFLPETIGAIVYLRRNMDYMKEHIIAGFNVSCVGDDNAYSYVASRYGDTLADIVVKNVLQFSHPEYRSFSYLQRGSDERQYNAPGVGLPVCGICRSKYGEYPEYHTSLDDLEFISPQGLQGAFDVLKEIINNIEENKTYKTCCTCEPQLGRYKLYPTLSQKGNEDFLRKTTRDILAYADGRNDLISISNIINEPIYKIKPLIHKMKQFGLLIDVTTEKEIS